MSPAPIDVRGMVVLGVLTQVLLGAVPPRPGKGRAQREN
jgi:hypothetical protein